MSHPCLLEVDITDASYGTAQVLRCVKFSMTKERLAILGRNGAGKTTLCSAITGLHRSTAGVIRCEGKNIRGLRPRQIGRLGVGYVPQGRRIFNSCTVEEHFAMLGSLCVPEWPMERLFEIFPALRARRSSLAKNLSGGEQQMLAIARAVSVGPKLLIMDEPSEGLAPVIIDNLVAACNTLIEASPMGILVVEQNLNVALRLSERVLVIDRGEIVVDLATEDFATRFDLQEAYLGVSRSI
ncbi:MAG: ABC transporter ATP-binding protein [bacterium]|nr:ABC transporter ATP-binding protein [bacterium]MCY4257383.1 ABC transporter ATP-binding protein [bacterium]